MAAEKDLEGVLWPDETIEIQVRQKRFGPGGSVVDPTTVIGTNKRIIIASRGAMGLRKDYEVVPYKQIVSVRLQRGVMSASVLIRLQGYDVGQGLLKTGKDEGEIDGLNGDDAQALANFIEKKISGEPGAAAEGADSRGGVKGYCPRCGAKIIKSGKYCMSCGAPLG
jgi:hypothetical protein